MCTGAFWKDNCRFVSHPGHLDCHASRTVTAATRTTTPDPAYIRWRGHERLRPCLAAARSDGFAAAGSGVAVTGDAGIAGSCPESFSAAFSTIVTGAINR